jgi:hypothetical protein
MRYAARATPIPGGFGHICERILIQRGVLQ